MTSFFGGPFTQPETLRIKPQPRLQRDHGRSYRSRSHDAAARSCACDARPELSDLLGQVAFSPCKLLAPALEVLAVHLRLLSLVSDSYNWWGLHGHRTPELKSLALKLLGQPASSSSHVKGTRVLMDLWIAYSGIGLLLHVPSIVLLECILMFWYIFIYLPYRRILVFGKCRIMVSPYRYPVSVQHR
jgi:hypothetical protein